jgi:hypothetical protein
MYEQDECIFCFEIFSPKNKDCINFDKDDIISCENYINTILNSTLTLKCQHNFHTGCFIKYIRTKYTTWKKTRGLDDINIFHVSCPFCRTFVKNYELLEILDYLTPIKQITAYISNTLAKLRFRMGLLKLSFFSRKLLNLQITMQETCKYLKMTEIYENWEFLDTKIHFLTKDTRCLYTRLLKNKECDFILHDDNEL